MFSNYFIRILTPQRWMNALTIKMSQIMFEIAKQCAKHDPGHLLSTWLFRGLYRINKT